MDTLGIERRIPSFGEYLFRDKLNRMSVIGLGVFFLLELIVFKYFYPYPAFINGDSYEYIRMAYYNWGIGIYPIGYPKFLRLFSVLSASATSLVVFQYFLMQISICLMSFTVCYFYIPDKIIRIVLLCLIGLNPVVLFMSNYVSSDSLFFSLSVIWFTSLIWMLNKPSYSLLFFHALVILFAFMVRYNALIYPLVSVIGFLLCRKGVLFKVVGILSSIVLIGGFIVSTTLKYRELTGVYQFSPFSGWQIANNGLYAYAFVDSSARKAVSPELRALDASIRSFFDTTMVFKDKSYLDNMDVSAVYMWVPNSPLRLYMQEINKDKFKDISTDSSEFIKWAVVAPKYKSYGSHLIHSYPLLFAEKYLWPNLINFYAPPVEFLGIYGYRADSIPPLVKTWFGFKTDRFTSRAKNINIRMLDYYPIACAVMNAVYIMMSVSFFLLGGRRNSFFRSWLLFTTFWLLNLIFSVFASPIALRFQIFPLLLSLLCCLSILRYMLNQSNATENVLKEKVEVLGQ